VNDRDRLTVLDAIESAEAEFEQLTHDKEWFVTSVTDRLKDAKVILWNDGSLEAFPNED
jgi:hypothetical protein